MADKIHAAAQIEITDLQRRAMARFFTEEAKKQNNIEAIINKALPEVTEQARPDQVEDDWITHFFDKCRLISDEEMQSLWARVLAGQVNSPGRYSKRTVEILSYLEKTDAMLFSKLCSFGIDIDGHIILFIYDIHHSIFTDNGITFEVISHLESLGLIQFIFPSCYDWDLEQKGYALYFGDKVWYDCHKPKNNILQVGHVLLTQAGQQLAPISGAQPIDGFFNHVKKEWKSLGFKTEPDAEQSVAADGIII